MLRNVHVFGKSDGLREALEERLQRAGASIVEDPSDSELVVGIDQQEDCDIAIIPMGSNPPKSTIVLELKDVIIPNGGRNWGNEIMIDWIRQIKGGGEPKTEPVVMWIVMEYQPQSINNYMLSNGQGLVM